MCTFAHPRERFREKCNIIPRDILLIFHRKDIVGNHEPPPARLVLLFRSFSSYFPSSRDRLQPLTEGLYAVQISALDEGEADCLTTPTTCPEKRNTCYHYVQLQLAGRQDIQGDSEQAFGLEMPYFRVNSKTKFCFHKILLERFYCELE